MAKIIYDNIFPIGIGRYNGAVNGNTSLLSTAGHIDRCFNFAGTYYAWFFASPQYKFNASNEDITMCFWVYKNADAEVSATILDKTESNDDITINWADDQTLNFIIDPNLGSPISSTSNTTGFAFSNTTWYHVICEFNHLIGSKIYVNNTLIYETNTTFYGTLGDTANVKLSIGADSAGNNKFDGMLEDFRIYKGILTQETKSLIYNSSKGTYAPIEKDKLVAHFPMNDNAVTIIVTDYKLKSYDGTSYNNTSTLKIDGQRNSAFNFNGINDYVTFGDVLNIKEGTPYSVDCWVRMQATNFGDGQPYMNIIDKEQWTDATHNAGYGLVKDADNSFLSWIVYNNGLTRIDSDILEDNEYAHIMIISDGTTLSLYHNNNLIDSTSSTGPGRTDTNDPLVFGAGSQNGAFADKFIGDLDIVRFWNCALSATERSAVYNNGIGTEADLPFMDKLLARWKLNENAANKTVFDTGNYALSTPVGPTSHDDVVAVIKTSINQYLASPSAAFQLQGSFDGLNWSNITGASATITTATTTFLRPTTKKWYPYYRVRVSTQQDVAIEKASIILSGFPDEDGE